MGGTPGAGGQGQLAGHRRELLERGQALRARRDVGGQEGFGLPGLLLVQGVEDVSRQELLDPLVVLQGHSLSPPSIFWSLRMAASVLVFTVPSGIPSSSAIWAWVRPPK